MKLMNKIIFLLVIIFSIFTISTINGSYALSNKYNIEFDLKKGNYKENFSSEFKEIKVDNIAPGTEGNINIKISNSNKNIKYILKFKEEKNKPQNMKFYYGEKQYNSLIELNNFLNGKIKKEEKIEIQIKYIWNYETGNNNYEIEKNDEIDKLDNNKIFEFKVLLEAEEDNESLGSNAIEAEENEKSMGSNAKMSGIKNSTENAKIPKTGDSIYIFLIILIGSIIGIYIVLLRLRNKNTIENEKSLLKIQNRQKIKNMLVCKKKK